MKKLLFLIVVYFCIAGAAFGYENIRTRINITTKNGYSLNNRLIFGIDRDATVNQDTVLGEWEVPPPPPEGVLAGFKIYSEMQTSNIFTFIDLRPYPAVEMLADTFYLKVWTGTGDLITFNWSPLWPEILSAKIIDAMTNGTLININMKDSSKALVNNEFIMDFLIIVVYDPQTSVIESTDNNLISLFPSPVTDNIQIKSGLNLKSYSLLNPNGENIGTGEIPNSNEISTGFLTDGVYFIRFVDNSGNSYIKKFVKIK